MNNRYEIRGDTTVIFLDRKDGTVLETIIDTADLPIADSFDGKWYAVWSDHSQSFYVYGTTSMKTTGKKTTVTLHRLLMDTPPDRQVDHLNHDTLNNCRYNIRNATRTMNQHNRKGAQRDNKSSGIRGVNWSKERQKWQAYIKFKSKHFTLGRYADKEVAINVSREAHQALADYISKGGDDIAEATKILRRVAKKSKAA